MLRSYYFCQHSVETALLDTPRPRQSKYSPRTSQQSPLPWKPNFPEISMLPDSVERRIHLAAPSIFIPSSNPSRSVRLHVGLTWRTRVGLLPRSFPDHSRLAIARDMGLLNTLLQSQREASSSYAQTEGAGIKDATFPSRIVLGSGTSNRGIPSTTFPDCCGNGRSYTPHSCFVLPGSSASPQTHRDLTVI